ncbi:histidine phosphatase family protein [Chitinolyticbacter meiyuanensis]|uniref:histidine phosphatase family protein n=1 Tax=Chitinolyticbacter meiyuanensis TaxID=682798 RepID=UPI0011E597BC|nr:histidine phosphatase family protein [Chitinolyticbacter meiyuanensis]
MSAFRLTLLRHGEAEGSAERLLGHTDPALTGEGWHQLRTRWRQIERHAVTAVGASDLLRCAAFARERAQTLGLPLRLDAGWRECHFGTLDGRVRTELDIDELAALTDWQREPERHTLPGGETWRAFQRRVLDTTEHWLASSEGSHRVLIAHGGTLRALLSDWLGLHSRRQSQLWLDYAAAVSLWCDDGYPPILLGIDNSPISRELP